MFQKIEMNLNNKFIQNFSMIWEDIALISWEQLIVKKLKQSVNKDILEWKWFLYWE